MAGEHCFPISPKGSKALKYSVLRGQAKYKILTVSVDSVLPGNGKSKTLPVQMVYLIHFAIPGTNEEVCQNKSTGSGYFVFQIKICSGTDTRFAHLL